MKKIIQAMKEFSHIKPSEEPEAIIIIGPPGSGKGFISNKLKNRFIILDIDKLRCEPDEPLDSFNESIYKYKTQADAEKRREDLMERYILERKNIVIEGGSGAKRWYETGLNIHYSGYKVTYIFIATQKKRCLENLEKRLKKEREEKGYGLVIDEKYMEYSFNSIPNLLLTVLKDKLKIVKSCIIVDQEGKQYQFKTKEDKYTFLKNEYKK